jgi:NitT/TauT family transport system substrate-binding protein
MLKRAAFTVMLTAAAAGRALPAPAQVVTAKLRVGTNVADNVTDLLWAKATGMFAKAGLDVDVEKLTSGAAVIAAVLGGSLDIGRSSLLPLISARAHGIPVQLIAPAEMGLADDPSGAIVTLKDSPVRTGRDLNGQTLPSPALKDYFEITLRAWIDQNGGDSSTVKFIELPVGADLAALESGRVAAAALANPILASVLATGKVRVIGRPNAAIGKRFLLTAWFATESLIAQKPDALARLASTLHQAMTYTQAHPAEAATVTAPFWGVDASIIAAMPRRPAADALEAKDVQPLIDIAVRYGVIDKPMQAETMIAPAVPRTKSP